MATIEEVYNAVMTLLDVMYEPHDFIDHNYIRKSILEEVHWLTPGQALDIQWAFLYAIARQVVDGRTDL